jgi:chloride channel protein, CIC family
MTKGRAQRTPPHRLLLLSFLAAVLGLASGGAAYGFIRLIGLLTNLALFHRLAWSLPSLAHLKPSANLVITAAAGGLVVSLMARWAPLIKGHGIPEAMEAVLSNQSRISPKTAIAKPISAAIAIGTGGPFGAEGPIIVTGGALGSLIGQLLPVSPSERKILLACGAAGGMAATFGAPLASVVLAIELLLFEFSARAFVPLVVSTALAAGVHSAIFGTGPLFAVPAQNYAGLDKLPLYGLLGLACGLLAVVINKGMFVMESGFRRLPISEFWHPMIGAVGFALIGLLAPRALGVGYDEISAVLAGTLAVSTLVVLVIAKLAAWWVSLASGTSGGTLAPLLLISGGFGSLMGTMVQHVWPAGHVSPGAFALVAMAAAFGASIRATFTAIVFLFELTRDYQIILPLMLASVLAEFVATALTRDSLMTEKLTRRGLRVQSDYEADVLSSVFVADVMTRDVITLPDSATIEEAGQLLKQEEHDACPIVDSHGRCVAIVTRRDLLAPTAGGTEPVLTVASSETVEVAPDDTLLEALHRLLEEGVTHLPVTDGTKLVGICTRTDILQARLRQFEREHLQQGWSLPLHLPRHGRHPSSAEPEPPDPK